MVDPKNEIEQALVAEAIDNTDYGRSFARIFNRENGTGTFSRIFSRGGLQLTAVSPQDLANMDEATFKKFAERLRFLEKDLLSEHSESKDR